MVLGCPFAACFTLTTTRISNTIPWKDKLLNKSTKIEHPMNCLQTQIVAFEKDLKRQFVESVFINSTSSSTMKNVQTVYRKYIKRSLAIIIRILDCIFRLGLVRRAVCFYRCCLFSTTYITLRYLICHFIVVITVIVPHGIKCLRWIPYCSSVLVAIHLVQACC